LPLNDVKHAVSTIEGFIQLVNHGIKISHDDVGCSVYLIHQVSHEVIRELQMDELMEIVRQCEALMNLVKKQTSYPDLRMVSK
jgi:uncharacterized FlaG/YvyC family protein